MTGSNIYKSKTNFDYPLKKDKNGNYKIKSGEQIRICMTSDFFLEEADKWRDEVWEIIKIRSDVKFFILTKRANRIKECLPKDWNTGYDNVMINVTCENKKRADERIPTLLSIPAKHKGIMVAPFIGEVNIDKYLKEGAIEQVIAGGENYDGSRLCKFDWVKKLSDECKKYNVTFCFIETGNKFEKDGKIYNEKIPTTKEEKTKLILNNNLAIYDVIKSCDIEGSADSSIKNVKLNNLDLLIQKSKIEKIIFNGNKAYELYNKYEKNKFSNTKVLPSTSPANAKYTLEDLCKIWSKELVL